jgi:hypothetical protein
VQEERAKRMSFTQDELQAFHTILEQKLAVHRREMEQALDQRLQAFQHELERHVASLQQDMLRDAPSRWSDQQWQLRNALSQQVDTQQSRFFEKVQHAFNEQQQQQHQQFESLIENALAAQLLAVEQLVHQHASIHFATGTMVDEQAESVQTDSGGLELQTELDWEDFIHLVGQAIDRRCVKMLESIQLLFKGTERSFTERLQYVQDKIEHLDAPVYSQNSANLQATFENIEQLERIVESLQVAMTANHALLSNRLRHHQHTPLEQAHVPQQMPEVAHEPAPQEQQDEQELLS